jgi:hypothetical protein
MNVEVLIPIVLFIATASVIVVNIAARHKERLAMIEKGLSGDEIKAMYARESKWHPLSGLKWGLLFAFTGAALIYGNLMQPEGDVNEGFVVGLVVLSAGVALMIYYKIAIKVHREGK